MDTLTQAFALQGPFVQQWSQWHDPRFDWEPCAAYDTVSDELLIVLNPTAPDAIAVDETDLLNCFRYTCQNLGWLQLQRRHS